MIDIRNKTAQYYDSYGHNMPLYWKMLWYIMYSYLDACYEEQGLHRIDWENWKYVAMQVRKYAMPTDSL